MLFSCIYWSTQIFHLAYFNINIAISESFVINDKAVLKTKCVAGDTGLVMALSTLKILSYNVWFQDLMIDKRMDALGDIIQLHAPDVICSRCVIWVSSHRSSPLNCLSYLCS